MAKKQLNEHTSRFNKGRTPLSFLKTVALLSLLMVMLSSLAFAQSNSDNTRPTILSISPENNERIVSIDDPITVVFSEAMDPSTINPNTFQIMQRTTPETGSYVSFETEGAVTYDSNTNTATFTPTVPLPPNQHYGNVFTVTITSGATDLSGNSISPDYVWSFITGEDPFNTGASTSQQGQNSNPMAETPAVTVVTQPQPIATPVSAANESAFPWVWVLGALLLLLLIAAIVYGLSDSKKSGSARSDPSSSSKKIASGFGHSNPHPFGDVHPVIDIQGIGPVYKEALLTMGIKNTRQLWQADAAKVARETGAPVSSVRSWQHMAELASVKDIGPQYAELLERSGVHSIEQLKNYDADKLLKLVRKKEDSLDVNIQGNSPGHATVQNWINEAKDHKFSSSEGQAA